MFCNSFARSLAFAGAAAAGLLVAVLLLPTPHLSEWMAVYLVAVAALYVAGIAPSRSSGLAAGAVASVLGGVLLLLPLDPAHTVIGTAIVVAVCRSALLYRARPLRAVLLEAVLAAGGLALARFLAVGSVGSAAFALWGYFLVQSAFFLVGGVAARGDRDDSVDPFDRARARLIALLDSP